MAQGTLTLFEEFALNIGNGLQDLDSDSFKLMLITNAAVPTAALATPDSSDFTEVSGTGYTAGGQSVTCTWTEAGGVASFKITSGTVTWAQNDAGPTDIYYAILYNTNSLTSDAIGFIDMTADGGTTPLSMQDGAVKVTFNAAGAFTLTIT